MAKCVVEFRAVLHHTIEVEADTKADARYKFYDIASEELIAHMNGRARDVDAEYEVTHIVEDK